MEKNVLLSELQSLIGLIAIIGIYLLFRGLGFKSYSGKNVKKGYEEIFIKENGEIWIVFEEKFLFFFKRKNSYKIKYCKAKGTEEEVKKYFEIVLKDPFIVYKFNEKLFSFKKKSIEIFIRNTKEQIAPFNKMPIYLLPKIELKNAIGDGIRIDVLEVASEQFTTLLEKVFLKKQFDELDLEKGGKNE